MRSDHIFEILSLPLIMNKTSKFKKWTKSEENFKDRTFLTFLTMLSLKIKITQLILADKTGVFSNSEAFYWLNFES